MEDCSCTRNVEQSSASALLVSSFGTDVLATCGSKMHAATATSFSVSLNRLSKLRNNATSAARKQLETNIKEYLYTQSPMWSLGRGSPGCKAGVEIPV